MVEYFKEIQTKYHRDLELCLRQDYLNTAFGNGENIRQGVDRLLGYAGAKAGIPAPVCNTLKVADDGPVFSLGYAGEDPFFATDPSEEGSDALHRLTRRVKLLPGKIFGLEQAALWMGLAMFQPHTDLMEEASG